MTDPSLPPHAFSVGKRLQLWLAQGFGVGRLRKAPGTWGTLVGLLWTAALLWPRSGWIFCLGCAAGIGLSIWLCGAAERLLGRLDPGSVVLDEISAMPLCFAPWLVWRAWQGIPAPEVQEWAVMGHGAFALVGFLLFRLFDIWKPGLIGRAQDLPGGWGVTADDVLAALAAGGVLLVGFAWLGN